MPPPDTRRIVDGLCYAKAEAVTHDAKRIYGAATSETWLPGTVLEVINHKPDNAKRATTYILAKYKVGNTEHEKSIPLQSLRANVPLVLETAATTTAATTNDNENPTTAPPAGDVNNNNGTPPATDTPIAATTTPPADTGTPPPPPGGSGTPPTPPSPAAFANDGRAWFEGDVLHDVNGPTTVKMWRMTCQWTGRELSEGCDNGCITKYSAFDCFMACFPKSQLLWMVDRLNDQLVRNKKAPTTVGELLKWFGVLMLITRFEYGTRAEVWSDIPRCKYIPAPNFGQTGISRQRFDDLWRFMEWSYQPYPRPEDMSSEHWRWCLVQDFIDRVNAHRVAHFHPSDTICVDESISRWCGLGGSWINKGLPHYVSIDRKPEDGAEIQDSCCGKCNIMMRLKLVKTPTEEEALR